jgi:hypothetical protein
MDESRAESNFHNLGVLGAALFIPYTVEIDFETETITVYDPDSFLAPTDWNVLPLDFGNNLPILADINANDVLGLGALHHFNLIFDYARRRLLVKPNRFFGDPFERNMAGMVLEKTPRGESLVYWVDEGSDAETKGIRKGDVLEEVNGEPVESYSFLELKRVFEAEGETVEVKVRRDEQSRTVTLTLRRSV